MKSIGGFFDKFRNRALAQMQNLDVVAQTLKKYTGADIELKNIKISPGLIVIHAPQIVKNEIFIKKKQILKEISERISSENIVDIK